MEAVGEMGFPVRCDSGGGGLHRRSAASPRRQRAAPK